MGSTPEFYRESQSQPEKKVQGGRRSFRFPLESGAGVRAVVDGEPFPILDLGSHGIAIRLSRANRFVRGETLANVVLLLGNGRIESRGRVVHISHSGGELVCGIELKGLGPEDESRLQAFLQGMRQEYFVAGI